MASKEVQRQNGENERYDGVAELQSFLAQANELSDPIRAKISEMIQFPVLSIAEHRQAKLAVSERIDPKIAEMVRSGAYLVRLVQERRMILQRMIDEDPFTKGMPLILGEAAVATVLLSDVFPPLVREKISPVLLGLVFAQMAWKFYQKNGQNKQFIAAHDLLGNHIGALYQAK